jgi:hypothetical protein
VNGVMPLPNASFIGFTGTPIEKTYANRQAVFGELTLNLCRHFYLSYATLPRTPILYAARKESAVGRSPLADLQSFGSNHEGSLENSPTMMFLD